MTKKSDKRKSPRFQCLVPVEGKKGTTFDETLTLDISKTGMGLLSPKAIKINQKIPVQIVLDPQGDPVLVIARVQWVSRVPSSDQFRVGLKFDEVLDGTQSRISQYFSKS